ncbi:MAG: response regulator [Verrucomicrobiota bacterium]
MADDSASVRKVQFKELNSLGYEVTLAENGQLAMDALNHTPFDLLMTDWEMPIIDGAELIRQVRQSDNQEIQSIPIIVISSKVDQSFSEHAEDLGATLCLAKPFNSELFHEKTKTSPVLASILYPELDQRNA